MVNNGVTNSNNGPSKEFKGDDYVVGCASDSTTLKIYEPPQEFDGVWQMVVVGVRLS